MLLKDVHFLLQHATIVPKPKVYIPIGVTCGMFAFLLAAAFECNGPDFWALRDGKCFDRVGTEASNIVHSANRPSDDLLDLLWYIRYCYRSLFGDDPYSCDDVSTNAGSSKDEINCRSQHTALVSAMLPEYSSAPSLHSASQTRGMRNRPYPIHP